jgi:hypothetical protein
MTDERYEKLAGRESGMAITVMARPFRRYTREQRKAFIAVAVRIREAGGSRADALQEVRKLGYMGDSSYLYLLVRRADKSPVACVPKEMQERLRAQFDSLVRRGLIRGDLGKKP